MDVDLPLFRLVAIVAVGFAVVFSGTLADAVPVATAEGPDPPRTSECVKKTDGEILMPPADDFAPDCLRVEPGDRVEWTNGDTIVHDPGDGVPGDETSACFEATDFTLKNGMESTDTFGGEFHFDVAEENLTFENITFDGHTPGGVADVRDCPEGTWTYNDDGDVAFSYICHIHEEDAHGWIVVDLP